MLVKFRMSRRNWSLFGFPITDWTTSCVTLTSMRLTIGRNTEPRSTYPPR